MDTLERLQKAIYDGDGGLDGERLNADVLAEIARLRAALEPFARLALTRRARDADDLDIVEVPMAHCRAAQKAMAAE